MDDRSMQETLQYADMLKKWLLKATADEQGRVHAETIIAAAGQMAGTMIFRSFITTIPTQLAPGSTVLSDQANTLGPRYMNLMLATVTTLALELNKDAISQSKVDTKLSHLTLLQVQERVDTFYYALAKSASLTDLDGAQLFAIVAGMLINECKGVYNIVDGCALAVYGMMEGSKTMPRVVG